MDWVLRSPQIHSTFSNLGYQNADGYHVNENCNAALETILDNILTEDKCLRTFRRTISFGQNVNKDLIPLLIHAKEDKTIELLIRILVNLTIPIECLLSVENISKNDFGRHTIFEMNSLLTSTKVAFTDHKATKVVIDFLKKNVEYEKKDTLSLEQCTNISNSLLLLRNILHIPEESNGQSPSNNGSPRSVQNQILWNIFSQSIDKVFIKLMIISDASKWAVTMVQLIALLYKDQHVVTLQKFINLWLEASQSDSTEDNESNTSPADRDRGSGDSSPLLTSEHTSDSSDTGASGKVNGGENPTNKEWDVSSNNKPQEIGNEKSSPISEKDTSKKNDCAENAREQMVQFETEGSSNRQSHVNKEEMPKSNNKNDKKTVISENSDCGYGTQIENQESISTSSNDDESPTTKPVHQKHHNPKQRPNNKVRSNTGPQDRKRKKIVRRGKANIINVRGLSHKTPSDDDISNVLKEFTVDFLLKGYNSLVQTLQNQILTNFELEIDTSHFFWLVTYFLKFATQIELDLENVYSILSYDIVSYLTAEGVNLCEQFELAIKLDGNDLKPSIRRLHLVVTAIREIIQAIDVYRSFSHLSQNEQQALLQLKIKMCDTDELRSLFVLLLRHYNPKYHTKQYLQDIIVTNHILLMFVDNTMKLPEYNGSTNMCDHIQQFASLDIMHQYGLLLEDYLDNGEFVNDCIFTLMHHVGGELGSLITLFQPKILKIFTSIWKSEFEICDDWSDLIEYVINTFVKKPHTLHSSATIRLESESFEDEDEEMNSTAAEIYQTNPDDSKRISHVDDPTSSSHVKWTDDELSSLRWNYMQCNSQPDVVGEIIKYFKEDGVIKSTTSVIHELFKQNMITRVEFDSLIMRESGKKSSNRVTKETREDEITKLCEQIATDGKSEFLDWVQIVLLETCFAKIYLQKKLQHATKVQYGIPEVKSIMEKLVNDSKILSPVSYHSLLSNKPVPLVPWNSKQAAICKDLKFLQLLHRLGFLMPVDCGKLFIRIPHSWTAAVIYSVAEKISPINKSKLKFSLSDLSDSSIAVCKEQDGLILSMEVTKDITMIESTDNFYQIHKQKHLATMVNFTPMPGSSYNSDGGEVSQPNWLEIIRKSQEYKISLDMKRLVKGESDGDSGIAMSKHKDEPMSVGDMLPGPCFKPSGAVVSDSFITTAFGIPPIMSITHESLEFNVQVAESDNNSVCETASVASDLTRMYVSDEDDKPEKILRPVIKHNLSDSDNASPGKRARLHNNSF